MSEAVVYVAAGRKYAREAYGSALTVRRQMPLIPIYLKLGQGTELTDEERQAFTYVQNFSARNAYIDKHRLLEDIPEERVLFLDGDTHVCADLTAGFEMLDRFEVAAAHAPSRLGLTGNTFGIPAAFPEFNTGVILCRNTERVRQVFQRWADVYDELGKLPSRDQPAFRIVMWRSDLAIGVLPPEFNARLIYPTFVSGKVYVIHCREPNMEQLAERVNASQHIRVFDVRRNRGRLKRAVKRIARYLHLQR